MHFPQAEGRTVHLSLSNDLREQEGEDSEDATRVDMMKEGMIKEVFVPLGIGEDKPFGELKLPRMRDSMAQMTCKPVGVNGLSDFRFAPVFTRCLWCIP